MTANRVVRCTACNLNRLQRLSVYKSDVGVEYISLSHRLRTLKSLHNSRLNHSGRFGNSYNASINHTTNNTVKPSNAPLTNNPSNILQEKAQNAARLHAELNALLEAQAERQVKHSSKPFGSTIKSFFQTNRKEFLNIFAAFMCVLLAWQIITMRRAARRLLDITKEQDQVIQDLRSILRKLHSPDEEFVEKIVQEFIMKMNTSSGENLVSSSTDKRPTFSNGVLHIFSTSSRGPVAQNDAVEERMKSLLHLILRQELDKIIGTTAMSKDEIAQKKMLDLQKEMDLLNNKGPNPLQGDDIIHVLDSINRESDTSTTTGDVLKKSRGFI